MEIIVFSDIHQDWQALRKIVAQKADIYILDGDLSDIGRGLDSGSEILAPLKEKLWFMPGNNETWRQTKDLCQKYGFTDFHQKIIKQENFIFGGLGYSLLSPFNTPGEVNEEEFAKSLKEFTAYKNLCLFCHNPAKDTQLDILPNGLHVGSQAIRKFIEINQPIYFFSGHIHENEGKIQRLKNTTCFGLGKSGLKIYL